MIHAQYQSLLIMKDALIIDIGMQLRKTRVHQSLPRQRPSARKDGSHPNKAAIMRSLDSIIEKMVPNELGESLMGLIRHRYRMNILKSCLYEVQLLKGHCSNKRKKRSQIPDMLPLLEHIQKMESQIFKIKNKNLEQESQQYKLQMRRIIYNLRDDSNREFRQNIIFRNISAERIVTMSEFDCMPTFKKQLIIHSNKRLLNSTGNTFEMILEEGEDEGEGEESEAETNWQISEYVQAEQERVSSEDKLREILVDLSYYFSSTILDSMKHLLEQIPFEGTRNGTLENFVRVFNLK